MYAVIETGGKQYKVAPGDEILVEKLGAEANDTVSFDVLLISLDGSVQVGRPVLEGVKAVGKVIEHGKAEKIVVLKYKPKKKYRKKQGHRQPYTRVEIISIG